jgi:hypothetical protein
MKYRVVGANAATGKHVEIDIEARSERDALEAARHQGVFGSSVRATERVGASTKSATPISGGKLFLIVTAAVACGMTIALVCYSVFFAVARSSTGQKDLNPGSRLSMEEQAFVKAIESGDIELVREYLTTPLDWKRAATPALKGVVMHDRFRAWSYESENNRERLFWMELAERLVSNGADVTAALGAAYAIEELKFLIAHKANVNVLDATGDAALHRFARDTSEEQAALLITSGANVNAVGTGGNTPLHCAAKNNAVRVINRLLAAGANVNAKNAVGQTPLGVANVTMQKEAAAVLKQRGAQE